MPHSVLVGITECGKTTLGIEMAKAYKAQDVGVLVLDPFKDPRWDADFITSNPDEFLNVLWDSEKCACFIDESADMIGRYDKLMIQTATRGRHWGHNMHYLTQRGQELSKTVRSQCRHLFLFSICLDDAKIFAKEYNKNELLEVVDFPAGEYYHAQRFKPLERGKLW